jgi:Holliday junction resolvase RusA-like endonuclease
MSERITFTVLGRPEPQGSTKAFMIKGRPRITSANAKMKPYRQQVGWSALQARADAGYSDLFAGRHVPVSVAITFWYAKPPSVPKKREQMCVKPDLDKICRSTFDALTGIIFADDSQVVQLIAGKLYGLPERAEITVTRLQ